jgi:RNA-directed DNA polymerase
LTVKLRLKVNESKSAVARPEERKFLGFTISDDGSERRIAAKALDRFKTRVRELTCRTRGVSVDQLIEPLARYLIGWRGYFGFCQTPRVLSNLDARICRRLRMYIWRQWQNGPNRFKELRRRGVPKFNAAVAAGSPTGFWRMSRHPAVQQALRNRYFDSIGLPRVDMTFRVAEPTRKVYWTKRRGVWTGRDGCAWCRLACLLSRDRDWRPFSRN